MWCVMLVMVLCLTYAVTAVLRGVIMDRDQIEEILTECGVKDSLDLFKEPKHHHLKNQLLMDIMKYPNLSQSTSMAVNNGTHVDDVDPLFISSCWNSNSGIQTEFIDAHKLILDGHISNLGSDKLLLDPSLQDDAEIETKATMEALDNLLSTQNMSNSLAELKPLPPFTGYTANLSINGIQGHHYHTISQRNPEENNNFNSFNEHNIVSSSTCNVNADSAGDQDSKSFFSSDSYTDCVDPDSVSSIKYEDCSQPDVDSVTNIKTEVAEYDISSIDDIAAIIGSAIADTTVSNNNKPESDEHTGSRDSWMDLDAWIDGACVDQQKGLIITQDGLSEFVIPSVQPNNVQPQQSGSTLESLLTHGYMPLLHSRLQNGPGIKQEASSSSNYGNEMITTSSPPNVVSTTDNLLVTVNGRFLPQYISSIGEDHRIRSPDILHNYPHTTTTTPNTSKKSRSRAQKKQQQMQQASATLYQSEQTLGLMGKEKPLHRCKICNRGFLNKSNIKVHERLHTGEKPFRCETCSKAFRQKAHLLKHQHIHKRIGRD